MVDIINDTEISFFLIRMFGLLFLFVAVAYFLITKQPKKFPMHSSKRVAILSLLLGLFDAGLTLTFGKAAFVVTPIIVASFFVLWIISKNPLWKFKHLLFFAASFVICSTTFFYGVAGLFFHLAVEGKL